MVAGASGVAARVFSDCGFGLGRCCSGLRAMAAGASGVAARVF
jgi:hypothetical protein